MFGVPTHRTRTRGRGESPECEDAPDTLRTAYGCDDYGPPYIRSALRLAEMKWNHFTMLISQDWKNLRAWGTVGSAPGYGLVGVPGGGLGSSRNFPDTVFIDWVGGGAAKEPIIYLRAVAWGNGYSIFRTANNSVYGTGSNSSFILNTAAGSRNTFQRILENVKYISIAGGLSAHTIAYIKTNGRVYALGRARTSGFGPGKSGTNLSIDDGTETNYLGIGDAKKVFVNYHGDNLDTTKTFVLKQDNTVYATGYNAEGGLGVNSSSAHVQDWLPVVKQDGTILGNVIDVLTTNDFSSSRPAVGGNTSFFLTNDGEVYVCGANNVGQLGLGLPTSATRPYATKIPNIEDADILAGTNCGRSILVTTKENKFYSWGYNSDGECGIGGAGVTPTATHVHTTTDRVTLIHGGGPYGETDPAFVVVTRDGYVWVCGNNQTRGLGIGNVNFQTTFIRNRFFGYNAPDIIDAKRFPIIVTGGTLSAGSSIVVGGGTPIDYQTKTFATPGFAAAARNVYVLAGYYATGPGIPADTTVTYVDRTNNEIHLSNAATATTSNITITYMFYPRAWQADLCGYPGEQSVKVVSEDGTLYQSGWNQLVSSYWNFNPTAGTDILSYPTTFEANF